MRQERSRDAHRVSTALEDQAPPSWELFATKGKPVTLSSAGFVLHFGQTYQLRVAAFAEGESVAEIHLISSPPFISRTEGSHTVARHGRDFVCLTFQVHREIGWLRLYKAPAEIRFGDLRIECRGKAGDARVQFDCPVVARTRWSIGIIILLSFWAVLTWLLGQVEHLASEWFIRGELSWQSNPRFWLWPLLLAGVYPLAVMVSHVGRLRQRSQELEARYLGRYRPT
jgi:hypothetical protein